MSIYSRFYLHIPIPGPFNQRVQRFQRKWHQRPASAPHITTIAPGILKSRHDWRELREVIEEGLGNLPPFPVTLTGEVANFNNRKVIYLVVKPSIFVVSVQRSLHERVKEILIWDRQYTHYIPHLTLASNLQSGQGGPILQDAQTRNWQHTFLCNRLCLLGRKPDAPSWTVLTTFHLR